MGRQGTAGLGAAAAPGVAGQDLAAMACPTTPASNRAVGEHWGDPSFRHLPEARASGGPGLVGSHSWAWLWGAGGRPCCGINGAGTNGPWGLKWGPGPWARGREPQRGQGQAGLVGAIKASWGTQGHGNLGP